MSDVPVTIVPSSSPDFGDKTPEELADILDVLTSGGELPSAPEPSPAEEEKEPEAEAAAPEETAEAAAPEEPATPEDDLASIEKESDRLSREKLEAQLSLLMAHNSRLAGKLGFLEQRLNQPPQASEPYEPQSQQEVDRLTVIENELAQFKERDVRTKVSQAVADAIGTMEGPWVQELAAEVAQIAPKYAEQIKAAQEATDPELARQIAVAVATMVRAEAMDSRLQSRRASVLERKEAATADMAKAKRAQTPSGSGSVAPPQQKQKSLAELTPEEADAWLRRNLSY